MRPPERPAPVVIDLTVPPPPPPPPAPLGATLMVGLFAGPLIFTLGLPALIPVMMTLGMLDAKMRPLERFTSAPCVVMPRSAKSAPLNVACPPTCRVDWRLVEPVTARDPPLVD